MLEVEMFRRVAERAVGRTIERVEAPDAWFLKGGIGPADVRAALGGATIRGTDRIGKLLLVDVGDDRPELGLRFGMTGRLVLGEHDPVGQLEYSSGRDDPAWDRFALRLDDGGRLRLSDPRRLGGVELDPDREVLGPDAWSVTGAQLRRALAGSEAPLKARLLDQARLAGLGNLLVDETLWRARLDPRRPAGSLGAAELRRLRSRIASTVDDLFAKGGSHRGHLQEHRVRGGRCPRCGGELDRTTVGGRTTYWCPACVRSAEA
ncbi:MAG: DNA-formamidopyrimidine glycosylase family protein [Acidimicrobiales bacterium]